MRTKRCLPAVLATAALLLAGMTGCRGEARSGATLAVADLDGVAVARYEGGAVTVGELDQRVLDRHQTRQQMTPGQRLRWYERLIREIVVDRLLLEASDHDEVSGDERLSERLRSIEREIVVDTYLERTPLDIRPVSDDDVRRAYDASPTVYEHPARRKVRHIYRGRAAGQPVQEARRELSELRRRVVAGESFAELASRHSESETRAAGGDLGWLVEQGLAPELAELVFSLEPGVPSGPVTTLDGCHLFLVEAAVEAGRVSFVEAAPLIRRRLGQQRRRVAMERLVRLLPEPANLFVADPATLRRWLETGPSRALALRVGETEITVGRLRFLLENERARSGEPARPDDYLRLLERLEWRARIFESCAADGFDQGSEVRQRVGQARRAEQVRFLREQRLSAEASAQTQSLERFYRDNRMRFTNPLRLDVLRLRVPLSPVDRGDGSGVDLAEIRQRLGQACSSPADGRLEAVAEQLGGEVRRLGLLDYAELRRLDARAAALAVELDVGQCSTAFRNGGSIEVIELADRVDPAPLPLSNCREEVLQMFRRAHADELNVAWQTRLLAEAGLEVLSRRLEAVVDDPRSML